jgi:glycosyltransferase involved in cell wall biosynthesis
LILDVRGEKIKLFSSSRKEFQYDLVIILNSVEGESGKLSYEINLLKLILNQKKLSFFNIALLVRDRKVIAEVENKIKEKGIKVHVYENDLIVFILAIMSVIPLLSRQISKFHKNRIEKLFESNCYYFLSPNQLCLTITNGLIITTIWDFGHIYLENDPDASSLINKIKRSAYYHASIKRSNRIVVDSEVTSKIIVDKYKFTKEKINVIGLPISDVNTVQWWPRELQKNKIFKYLIYPATNWQHKNHEFLIQIYKEIRVTNPDLKLLLCGPRLDTGVNIKNLITRYEVVDHVIDLNYLTKGQVNYLIQNANLLVMPTLLGPTNYPVFEAAALGTRSIISEVHDKESLDEVKDLVTIVESWEVKDWVFQINKAMPNNLRSKKKKVNNKRFINLINQILVS